MRPQFAAPLDPPQPPSAKPASTPTVPALRATYIEAVALYERGLQALQTHDYTSAAELFRSVLVRYPEEKELQERIRLYLNVCERQIAPRRPTAPTTVEERLYAGTLALNAGEYDQALSHTQTVLDQEPENDHAHYMQAVAYTLRGDLRAALQSLVRSIELNPENRALAKQDPDLEALRQDENFRQAIDAASPAPRPDKRRPSRGRFTR